MVWSLVESTVDAVSPNQGRKRRSETKDVRMSEGGGYMMKKEKMSSGLKIVI